MINMIFKIAVIFLAFSLFATCDSTPDLFEGEWVENKNPENVWLIKKKGDKFIGTRVSGADKFKTATETWTKGKEGKFQDPTKHIPVLNPVEKGGTKITYMATKDMILRLPPGTSYKRKNKTE